MTMTRRSILGFLLILSSSELSRIAARTVFVAGGGGGTSSSDYPLSSPASSFSSSSSSLQKKTDFNLPASLRNYGPSEVGKKSARSPNGTPEEEEGHRSNEDHLSTRVARAKRRTLLRGDVNEEEEEDAYLGNSNVPSNEILVRPDDVFNSESPYGDRFISRNPRVDRRGYIGDGGGEEPLTDTLRNRKVFDDKRSLRDPGLFLIARLRTNRRLYPDEKRKWKSKNMAMWGR